MTSATETFIQKTDLAQSLLIGYYGGGNYGDELLLEVIAHLLKAKNTQQVTVTYQKPEIYQTFHHDFGFDLIPMADRKHLVRAIAKNKNIVIGGGGLWGLDVNFNIFLLSFLLFLARFVLRKRVYLLGVGYYNSTSTLGRISAWLAGKAANHIIARDQETLQNFQKISSQVSRDHDLAWQIPNLDLTSYESDLKTLEKKLAVNQKTLFVTLRRFKPNQQNRYAELLGTCIVNNSDKNIIISLMEPKEVDPNGYTLIRSWQKKYSHVQIADFSYNPLALYLFFRKHHKKLALIGPQFHIIITAYLSDVPYLPVVYDNKVAALFDQIGLSAQIPIKDLELAHMQSFIDSYFRRRPT